jgi:hypothetical protein
VINNYRLPLTHLVARSVLGDSTDRTLHSALLVLRSMRTRGIPSFKSSLPLSGTALRSMYFDKIGRVWRNSVHVLSSLHELEVGNHHMQMILVAPGMFFLPRYVLVDRTRLGLHNLYRFLDPLRAPGLDQPPSSQTTRFFPPPLTIRTLWTPSPPS